MFLVYLTCIEGDDYSSFVQDIVFSPGSVEFDVTIIIHGDILFENVEDFFTHLELITNDPLIIIRPATAEITISDENGLCSPIMYIIVS